MGGLLEGDLEVVAQVGAATGPAAATSPAAEKFVEDAAAPAAALLAEDLAEDVEGIVESAAARASRAAARSTSTLLEGGVAEAVVGGALLRILQDFIGLGDLLEHLLRLLVARILVGMKLHGLLAVGLLHFLVAGPLGHAEQLVIVFLFGSHLRSPLLPRPAAPVRSRRSRKPAGAGAR